MSVCVRLVEIRNSASGPLCWNITSVRVNLRSSGSSCQKALEDPYSQRELEQSDRYPGKVVFFSPIDGVTLIRRINLVVW